MTVMEETQTKQIKKRRALLTGASGMLGSYVSRLLSADFNVDSLGRGEANTIRCDLIKDIPELSSQRYELVVHCAGSEDDSLESLNSEGTRHLLQALSGDRLPQWFVYVSSYSVYGKEGENLTEDTILSPQSPVSRSKEKGEREVTHWAQENGVVLTIIRPARMFGTGVHGETLRLFNDALNGSFIHIRGNNARVSLVTSLDVAKAIVAVYKIGGVYNLADGKDPKLIEMVQAMTANAGREKRMTTLPSAWAAWIWRLCRWIPAIDRNLNPSIVGDRLKTLTIDGTKISEIAGLNYYNTIEVIARRDADYPYDEK